MAFCGIWVLHQDARLAAPAEAHPVEHRPLNRLNVRDTSAANRDHRDLGRRARRAERFRHRDRADALHVDRVRARPDDRYAFARTTMPWAGSARSTRDSRNRADFGEEARRLSGPGSSPRTDGSRSSRRAARSAVSFTESTPLIRARTVVRERDRLRRILVAVGADLLDASQQVFEVSPPLYARVGRAHARSPARFARARTSMIAPRPALHSRASRRSCRTASRRSRRAAAARTA